MVQAAKTNGMDAETGRLKLGDVIRRFADKSPGLAKHWTLRSQSIDDLLLAIFREIDETILPREITLSTDADAEVRLLIANRRLLLLDINDGPEPLDPTEDDNIENVAEAYTNKLHSVIKRSGEVHIRCTARELASASSNKSCSAQSLAASVGLPLRAAKHSENINAFYLSIEKLAIASVRYQKKSGQAEWQGDETLAALLTTIAERDRNIGRQSGSSTGITSAKPSCSVFRLNRSMTVFVAQDRDEKVLFIVQPTNVGAAMSRWQKIYAVSP